MITNKQQVISTLSDILSFIAPSLGGSVPSETSDEYADWVRSVQVKYEEASRRGFWRRLLKKSTLSLTEGDTEVLLPVDFQRANGLYICYVDGVDLADPDIDTEGQSIWAEVINDSADADFGRWKLTFSNEVKQTQTAPIWYFASPPIPNLSSDKVLLPGDMIGYGAMSEIFRHTNLEGSLDDARAEFERRLNGYLAMEEIPERYRILQFSVNPRGVDRLREARTQYFSGRATRNNRLSRSF